MKKFEDYYVDQAGRGLAHYQGQSFQKGYGIGGWFKSLFRTAVPFLVRGAKAVGKEALRAGTKIAGDVLEGENLKRSAEQRAKEVARTLTKKAVKKADDMLGHGKVHKRRKKPMNHTICSKVKKVKRRDIFDPY